MPTINFDPDNAADESGVSHESIANTDNNDSGVIKQGYAYSSRRPLNRNGLVCWWPLTDDSAQDYVGNNDATLQNGVTSGMAGKYGLHAMSFDDSNSQYIDFPDSMPNEVPMDGSSDFTISIWINHFRKSGSNNNDYLCIFRKNTHIDCTTTTNSERKFSIAHDSGSYTETISNVWTTNEWIHYTFVFHSGGDVVLYENGVESARSSPNTTSIDNKGQLNRFSSATWDTKGYLDGKAADLRIYNRALSSQEIELLYAQGTDDFARPTTNGLVSHYRLDGDVVDETGNYNATNNGITFESGVRGQAGYFDGTDNVDLGHITELEGTNSLSVSAWVKSGANEKNDGIFAYGDSWNDSILLVNNEEQSFDFRLSTGGTNASANAPFVKNEYVHLVGTFGSDKVKIYLNGELKDSDTLTLSTPSISNTAKLGLQEWIGHNHTGNIDDVRIYNRALEPWEIHEIYQYGTKGRDLREQLVRA